MSYKYKEIETDLLVINTENPRYELVGNQREAIILMIENQKDKLVRLAKDIVENGINPSDLIIVTAHEKLDGKFNVLEGNRRITALKLLMNPNLIPEKYKNLLNRFRELSKKYFEKPISKIRCVVFDNENEALRWVKLKHTGENEGVGTVTWDAQQKARFEERFEGKSSYALQVIEFLRRSDRFDDKLKEKLGNLPISSLQRLISDPDVRKVIGLDIKNGKIISVCPPGEILKPLTKIVLDLLKDDFTVKEIYYKDDRANYIETFKQSDLPDKSKVIDNWELITPTPPKDSKSQKTQKKKSKSLSTTRNNIIPKSCIIHIGNPRINKLYRELKDLDLRFFVNAAAITLRVFFELSLDEYIEKKELDNLSSDTKLATKAQKVAEHLEKEGHLNKAQTKPVKTAISNPNSILSINTFNAYVHNKFFTPIPNDLKTTWDNIEPFMVKLWDVI